MLVSKNTFTSQSANDKFNSALQLLTGAEISISTFENVRTLIKGFHPGIDEKLEVCSTALSHLQKIQSGDIISLSAESLPEQTETQRKRKKALIFFIESVKNLKSEIKRVQHEFSTQQNASSQIMSWGRIIKFAKGPLGLVTLAAVIIVVAMLFFAHKTAPKALAPSLSVTKTAVQVIMYQGKQLPLSGLYIGHGPDCDSPHYHAVNGKVTALDGTVIVDPEGCGFGKVANTQVTTVTQ